MIPQTIGRYQVLGLLGEGAFGQVYAARDPTLGRSVAIKVLRAQFSNDPSFMDRFHGEAASLAGLTHPNITMLYDLLQDGGHHCMIMELVRGHTLEHVLSHTSRLGLRETLAVMAQTVSGLGYIHRMGVVHRDIKPANMMLTETGLLKIMDFGIARVQGAKRLTREGSIVGTLAYLAPEQIKGGEGDARSDLYSLACVLYEMLAGDPPFSGASEYDLIQAHVQAPPDPLSKRISGLPDTIEQALARALAKNPSERFQTAEAFGRALGTDAVQADAVEIVRDSVVKVAGPIVAAPTRVVPLPPRNATPQPAKTPPGPPSTDILRPPAARSSLAPVLALGGAAVLVVAVLGFILLGGGPTPPAAAPGNPLLASNTSGIASNTPGTAPNAAGTGSNTPGFGSSANARPAGATPVAPATASGSPTTPAAVANATGAPRPPTAVSSATVPLSRGTLAAGSPATLPPSTDTLATGSPATGPSSTGTLAKISPATTASIVPTTTAPAVATPATMTPALPRSTDTATAALAGHDPPVTSAMLPNGAVTQPGTPASAASRPLAASTSAPLAPSMKMASLDTPPLQPPAPLGGTVPPGPPAYEGHLVDWLSGSTIMVPNKGIPPVRLLRLFGVSDVPGEGNQTKADDIRHQLLGFIDRSGGQVTCFTRDGGDPKKLTYQCFANHQDIALWAVANHLAQFAPDAPQDYREARQ